MNEATTQIDDGGPAFPLQSIGPEFPPGYCGMTLRDYFAAKAIPAAIDCTPRSLWHRVRAFFGADYAGPMPIPAAIAAQAYKVADAMLAARKAVSQ